MKVEINPRGNGACPVCDSQENCRVHDTVFNALEVFSEDGDPMELVVYSCPKFQEKKYNE